MNSEESFRKKAEMTKRNADDGGVSGIPGFFAACSVFLALTALPAESAGVPDADSFMIVALVAGLVLVIFVINVLLAVWAYKDAGQRGMKRSGIWIALVALLGAAGLILYMIVRPKAYPEASQE